MITPLMHILSCLDKDYSMVSPLSILYLNKVDRDVIISEAKRMCDMLFDGDIIAIDDQPSLDGRYLVSRDQVVNDSYRTINVYTQLLLTRIRDCARKYVADVNNVAKQEDNEDLSAESTVLNMEGNPEYVYKFVYTTMRGATQSNFGSKIEKLQEIYSVLISHTDVQEGDDKAMLDRLGAQAQMNYWRTLLMRDYMQAFRTLPPEFNATTVEEIREDLQSLGFYGFVNPLEMYNAFSRSRIGRKSNVVVEPTSMEFLRDAILAGGGKVE